MTVDPHSATGQTMADRDIAEVLEGFLQAYPEDVFPTPPPERQAKDAAAAHIMRVLAYPTMAEALAEIRTLRQALYQACAMVDIPDGVVLDHEDGTALIDGLITERTDES